MNTHSCDRKNAGLCIVIDYAIRLFSEPQVTEGEKTFSGNRTLCFWLFVLYSGSSCESGIRFQFLKNPDTLLRFPCKQIFRSESELQVFIQWIFRKFLFKDRDVLIVPCIKLSWDPTGQ
jgi:hypothetical protein